MSEQLNIIVNFYVDKGAFPKDNTITETKEEIWEQIKVHFKHFDPKLAGIIIKQ